MSTLAAEPEVAVEDLVEASMQLSRARVQWLRPEFVFELARRGKFDEAIDRMAVLSSGGSWPTAATVCVAWMAALHGRPEVATRLLPDVVQDGPPLGVLGARVRSAIDPSVPPPELVYSYGHNTLDDWSSIKLAAEVIERFGSSSAEGVVYSGLAALRESRRSTPSYGTELDAPVVVAAARDVGEGDALLEQYIGLHSANPYASYRDRSLWVILGAVACLPDADQALRHAIRLCEGAFAPSPVRFVEALYLSVANRPGHAPRLNAMRRNAVGDARELRRQYSLYSRGRRRRRTPIRQVVLPSPTTERSCRSGCRKGVRLARHRRRAPRWFRWLPGTCQPPTGRIELRRPPSPRCRRTALSLDAALAAAGTHQDLFCALHVCRWQCDQTILGSAANRYRGYRREVRQRIGELRVLGGTRGR